MVTLPESTMNSGASCSPSAASTIRVHSSVWTRPDRTRSHGTLASPHSRRIPISHRLISSENIITGDPASTATLRARFVTSEDLPTPGLAATTIRFPGCNPDSRLSRSTNPVGIPANGESRCWMCSSCAMLSSTRACMGTTSSFSSWRETA